ncbi:lactococcin 972 family bacteriocin [Streptomyces sp. NPDC127051]|uniref:lactococcin 972 family bacteriocin n=1 Tax=Streptomyces sp. NPDC127051 TaxID=3347119 RepID=UPI00366134CD
MKKTGVSAALAAASAILTLGALATPACADSSQSSGIVVSGMVVHRAGDGTVPPAELGNPKEWGEVTLTITDIKAQGAMKPMTITNVGGGTWSYGWEARDNFKYCYSNYYHGSVAHGSSVKMAGTTAASGWVAAGDYSNAHYSAGFAYTCSTYWTKY